MFDPFDNIAADDGTAMAAFCGCPADVTYWASIGGMVYELGLGTDDQLARWMADNPGVKAWKCIDGRRV
jgi:hypothetical protein